MTLFTSFIVRPWRDDLLRTLLTIFAVALGVGVVIAIELAGDAAGGSFESSLTTLVGKVDFEIMANGGIDERIMAKLTGLPINAGFCPILQVGGIYGVDPFSCGAWAPGSTVGAVPAGRSTEPPRSQPADPSRLPSNLPANIIDIAEAQQRFHAYHRLDRIEVSLSPQQNFERAMQGIKSGDYPPKPDAYVCPGCPFYLICPA